jgi:signal transduction histidine kinase
MGEVGGPGWLRHARERLGGLRAHNALQRLAHTAHGLLKRSRARDAQPSPADPAPALRGGETAEPVQLDRRVREAIELRDELLAIVSHDLRNPLSTISICTALLADVLPRPARTREVMRRLDVIRRSVDQMERLIQDLLDAARADAGRLALEPHEFRLTPLLAEAVLMLRPLAAEKAQRLEIAVPDAVPPVRADRQRTLQVVSNLVGNAIKFAPPGGRITVRASRAGPNAVVCVDDSGAGIAPEDLPHVFERFWQARNERRTGAGLGLAIARSIVEAQGGRIWVESRPGHGARFFFTLPLARARPGGIDAPPGPA